MGEVGGGERNLSETAYNMQSRIVLFMAKIKLDSLVVVVAQMKGVRNEYST